MINVLIPAMGNSMFFENYYFPKLILEVNGDTMIEKVIMNYDTMEDKHFIFVLNQKDCSEFHIDQSIHIITENQSSVIVLKNQTQGALCTCLMTVEMINNENPLVIANCDQIIDVNYKEVVQHFCKTGVDAGVITFPSIHPRWSYVRLEGEEIVEAAEKRPISKHAIAGFYYFKHGSDFFEAAKKTILKKNAINGIYYISASLNEIILMGKKIGYYEINKDHYHSFYSPEKIHEYELIEGK